MSAPVFLVDRAELAVGDQFVLDGPEGRHAATVRRLRPGERADVTDGVGLLVECVVAGVGRDSLTLDVVARRRHERPRPRLVVVQALPKGDRGEWAVEMMTEVGVDEIVPWAASRSVTRWRPERRARALARWRSTAREAAKQSRRPWFPVICEPADTAEVAARVAAADRAAVLHETAGTPLGALELPVAGEIVMVVGPEGGISEDELAVLATAGGCPARLGPTVLRTSTAGVVAAAVVLAATRWRGGAQGEADRLPP